MKIELANDIRYVEYVVERYLRGKPNLRVFKDDMMQEGLLGLYKGRDSHNPRKGVDMELWLSYQIRYAITKYIDRKEVKHFRKPSVRGYVAGDNGYDVDEHIQSESQLWDLGERHSIGSLEDMDGAPLDTESLDRILDNIIIHEGEERVLNSYRRLDDHNLVAEELGVSRQYVCQVLCRIVERCREYVYSLDK